MPVSMRSQRSMLPYAFCSFVTGLAIFVDARGDVVAVGDERSPGDHRALHPQRRGGDEAPHPERSQRHQQHPADGDDRERSHERHDRGQEEPRVDVVTAGVDDPERLHERRGREDGEHPPAAGVAVASEQDGHDEQEREGDQQLVGADHVPRGRSSPGPSGRRRRPWRARCSARGTRSTPCGTARRRPAARGPPRGRRRGRARTRPASAGRGRGPARRACTRWCPAARADRGRRGPPHRPSAAGPR